MTRLGRWSLTVALISLAVVVPAVGDSRLSSVPVAAVTGAAAAVPAAADPSPDPFPLRRVFLPADRVAAVTAGPLRKLTKADFESAVRAASTAQATARTPPTLAAATYRGVYSAGRVRGTATWAVANPAGRPAPLALDPLRVALGSARWAGGREAVVFRGRLAGRESVGSYLSVDGADAGTVEVVWSARGQEEPEVERFEFGFPAAPIASLELTLPADRVPTTTTTGVLTTGPFPAADDTHRVWKFAFGGQPGLTVGVRRPVYSPVVLVSRSARYDLTAGDAAATTEFTFDCPRGVVRRLTFEVDAGLRVRGVTGESCDRWQFDAGQPAKPGTLTVWFREPVAAAKVAVSGVASPGSLPEVRAVGGVPAADAIEVVIPPESALDGWDAGDYGLSLSGPRPDRSVRLVFQGGLVDPQATRRRRPVVRVRPADVQVATREQLDWRLGPDRVRLSARLDLRVLRGPLPQLIVTTDPALTLDDVTVVPGDPGATFRPRAGVPGGWEIEPTRAVPTGQEVSVRLEFRGAGVPAGDPSDPRPDPVAVPFPRLEVFAAVDRQGSLTGTADADAGLVGRTVSPVAAVSPSLFSVGYLGRVPAGEAWYTPPRPVVRWEKVNLSVVNGTATARCELLSDDDAVGALTVFVPGGGTVRADGAEVRRLDEATVAPWLAGGTGWHAVAAAGVSRATAGSYWRVRFPSPKTGPIVVTVEHPLAVPRSGEPFDLPLPVFPGVAADGRELGLGEGLADRFRGEASGRPHTVRLTPKDAPPTVAAAAATDWAFRDARLVATASGAGDTAVVWSARISTAGGVELPVELPAGATLASAKVAGKWVPVDATVGSINLPVPLVSADGVSIELRYHLPTSDRWLYRVATAAPPPTPAVAVERRWVFDAGYRPWPSLAATGAGKAGAETVAVIPTPTLWVIGLVFAAAVAALAIRGGRVETITLAVITTVCGAAQFLTPDGWAVVTRPAFVVAAGGLLLRRPVRRTPPRPSTLARPVAAAGIALVVLLPAAAQRPDPATVYVVADGDGYAVYAPQPVLDKLAELTAPPTPPVVIAHAEYGGTVGDALATFDATYTLVCSTDGDHLFALPLAGVRLETITLDGHDAHPDATKPDRYTVRVAGRGTHTLKARFGVATAPAGRGREVRCSIPDVPACRVAFRTPAGATRVDVPTRRGAQEVEATATGTTVTADHGGGRTLAVRWQEPNPADAATPTLTVREAGVWDLTDGEGAVTAAFVFRVSGGPTDTLRLEVPDGLVPVKLVARSPDRRVDGVGVRDWTTGATAGGWTPIDVTLQQPLDGRLLVVLRAVPARPLSAAPPLRFPRAAGLPDADRDTLCAVRVGSLSVSGMSLVGAFDFPADALTKDFPPVPEFGFDRSGPNRVVRRAANADPELRPQLAPASAVTSRSVELGYTIGKWVEAEGVVRAAGDSLRHAEFDLPAGCDVRSVRADGLGGWTRAGDRIQLWLRQPTDELTVRWAGTLPTAGGVAELPVPTAGGAASVRVRPAEGWAVAPQTVNGVQPKPAHGGEFTYTADAKTPRARFAVRPVEPPPVKPAEQLPAVPASATVTPLSPAPLPANAPAADPPFDWPRFGVWAAVFAAAVGVLLSGRGHRRAEGAVLVGAAGLFATGWDTAAGWTFAAITVVGAVARLWAWLRPPR
jgi:hypothetical protein